MNIVEHVSLLHTGVSSRYMPRSYITGSSRSVMPSFLRNCQTDFQSGCTSLQPHQQWRSVSSFSTSLPAPVFSWVFDLSHSDWCEVKSQGCLICVSLMTKDVEHFFRCFSVIWYSSGENSLFSSVPHFLIGLFVSLESNFLSSLYILDISPLSDVGLVKICPQFVGCHFVLLMVSFALQKLF